MHYTVTEFYTNFRGISKTIEHEFSGDEPLENRRKAIEKAKELTQKYEENHWFVSPTIAKLKDYKDCWEYSIEISGRDDDEIDYPILMDDQDCQLEALEQERCYYEELGIDMKTTYCDGECNCYEVLDQEVEFLVKRKLPNSHLYEADF